MVAMVEVVDSMSLVLEKVACKFSIIQSWSLFNISYALKLKLKVDPEYSIYYCKSAKWIALAVEEDDECEWGVSGETLELHLLIVRKYLVFLSTNSFNFLEFFQWLCY